MHADFTIEIELNPTIDKLFKHGEVAGFVYMKLKVTDRAPVFEGTTEDGHRFSLSDLIGKSNLVLYFYPKDETFGCTKEACAFRDEWDRIAGLDATVIGVSSDTAESHASFKKHHSLPFVLVSDEGDQIRRKYGVEKSFLLPPRVTFVIDKQGVIRSISNSQTNIEKHVEQSMLTLKEIQAQAAQFSR